MAFIDILVEKGIIKKSELEAIAAQSDESGRPIDEILDERGVSSEEVRTLRADYFGIPEREIGDLKIPFDILKNVPEESALHYRFVPLDIEEGVLEVGVVDPDVPGARDAIQFIASKLGIPFRLSVISFEDFEKVITQYKGITGEVNKALTELETELVSDAMSGGEIMEELQDLSHQTTKGSQIIEEAPVTKIVAVILRHAIEGNASDIHIEHVGEKIRVRFRVDGVMHTSLLLPPSTHDAIVARIKILSNLKLDEKRKPQDGRFPAKIEGRKIDFRVSTFPAYYGEKVVMRILDAEKGVKSLENLGLTKENAEAIRAAIQKPYGMVLLTGPTGSGKTTTLYAMLNEIDRDSKNVVSLEDPVEYNIPGMTQSQIRPEIGYTFANGLRSILRQDPDIIMVGEIRDKETAQLAIQAALTGHLVLATLHTNNAAGVVPRLVDMGVDPFLIAPTIIIALAQRLVRRICPDGKKAVTIDEAMRMRIKKQVGDLSPERQKIFTEAQTIYESVPTPTCPTGMRGRIAVYEIMQFDKEIEAAVLTRPGEEEMYALARKKGMYTMIEDAYIKAFTGDIPFEQINELG